MTQSFDYKKCLIDNLKEEIKRDVNSGIEKTHNQYLDSALKDLKHLMQKANKWEGYKVWNSDDIKGIIRIWLEMEPEILCAIEKLLKEFKLKKITKEIQAVSAQVAIKSAMNEAGLQYQFIAQTHRAKVLVKITKNRALTMYIPYKKLLDQLPQIIDSLKVIRKELEGLGNNITINKAYGNWE
jgi:hypothetical protein